MNVARVLGTLWATKKYPDLEGAKIQVIQPLSCQGDLMGKPIAAVDTVGAGEGELVYYVTAYEAVIPFFRPMVPIDASIVGIIDSVDISFPAGDSTAAPRDPPAGDARALKAVKK